jgi:hypothetical protein
MVEMIWNHTFWGEFENYFMDIRELAEDSENYLNSIEDD